jgi:hypothetical protein
MVSDRAFLIGATIFGVLLMLTPFLAEAYYQWQLRKIHKAVMVELNRLHQERIRQLLKGE